MAMGTLTLDWGQVTYMARPSPPCWPFLPIASSHRFDNKGTPHMVSHGLSNVDSSLNLEACKAYSPHFLFSTFAIAYNLSFAAITAIVVYREV
jgi:hypothetical protein